MDPNEALGVIMALLLVALSLRRAGLHGRGLRGGAVVESARAVICEEGR